MKLGCVILAAGKGSRFGSNKLLAALAGKPLLGYVLEMLPRDRFDRVTAVVSAPETQALCRTYGIDALLYDGGAQSDSIRLGLSRMEQMDGCLFVMGDQPLCQGDSVRRMVDAFGSNPGCVYRLAYGGIQASPVLFPKETFGELSRLTGERGGMSVAGSCPGGIRTVEAGHAAELWDADTPQALAQMEDYLREKPV